MERSDELNVQRSLGRMEGQIEELTRVVGILTEKVDNLRSIKDKGWGILTAISLAAGTIGALAKSLLFPKGG